VPNADEASVTRDRNRAWVCQETDPAAFYRGWHLRPLKAMPESIVKVYFVWENSLWHFV